MELKNLLTKLRHKEEPAEHFFALEINNDRVKSAVWTVFEGQTKVLKLGSSETWDGTSAEDFLAAVDKSISAATENILPEPSSIIFGLPESWVDQGSISSEKKKFLKTICEELELKALGFVVTSSALIQYLRIQEGTPPSAIFLQIESGELNLILVKLGKIIGNELVGRSEDLGADVEEGLSRFKKVDTLPARMILFDGQIDFEEAKQQLTSYDWQEKLPFIHFPKVEVFDPDVSIKAVALAGGSEVAKSLGFEIKAALESGVKTASVSALAKPKGISAAELGFVANQDVAEQFSPKQSLGEKEEKVVAAEPLSREEVAPAAPIEHRPGLINSIKTVISSTLKSVKNKLVGIKAKLPKGGNKLFNPLSLALFGFFLFFLAVFAAYWYIPKATVTLFLDSRSIQQDLKITVDPKLSSFDPAEAILPGIPFDVSVTGEKSQATTGKALVGDPARGEVILLNKTNQTKTFVKDTVLVGPDQLVFALDEETTVASSSSQEKADGTGEEIVWGQAKASITAKNIGPDGNLSADSKLSFQQFSADDFSAKTEAGLSGGTAREVKAVSQEDQDNLLQSLSDELKLKAEQELQAQLGDNMVLVEVEIKDQLTAKQFNHAVGEEADSLKLEAKLEYTALSFRQNDLQLLLHESVKEKIPDGFQLADTSELNQEPAKMNPDGTATINFSYTAQLLPKLDFSQIKKNLVGRYPSAIQGYLASLPGFIRADIVITPNLPAKLKTLPRLSKHIVIELKTSL
jgi:hypothetical protein